MTQECPWYTPDQFAGNDVLRNVDLDGAEPMPATTGNETEAQSVTTKEERVEGKADRVVTHYQTWVYHEGGVNGSTAGDMKQEDYFEKILKPWAKADNEGDSMPTLNFAFSRKEYGKVDYVDIVNSVGKYIKENPTYDGWQSYLPVWGAYQQAKLDFSVNKNGWVF